MDWRNEGARGKWPRSHRDARKLTEIPADQAV